MVREYIYTMNGVPSGYLFLLDSPYDPPLASWLSLRTGLRTPWHGSWRSPSGDADEDLTVHFDFQGNPANTIRKWTMVRRAPGGQMVGGDYQLRAIRMQLLQVWAFDDATAPYVVRY